MSRMSSSVRSISTPCARTAEMGQRPIFEERFAVAFYRRYADDLLAKRESNGTR